MNRTFSITFQRTRDPTALETNQYSTCQCGYSLTSCAVGVRAGADPALTDHFMCGVRPCGIGATWLP